MFSLYQHLGEYTLGKRSMSAVRCFKLDFGRWEKALSKIGNNEVLTNESFAT